MKTKFIFILFVIQISIINGQKINLTLHDAVNLALNNNSSIKQYEEKLAQKELDNLIAFGNFLPSINFGFSYNHLNENMMIDLNPIREVILNLQSSNQTEIINLGNVISGKAPLTDDQKNIVKTKAYNSLNSIIPQFKETFKEQDFKTGTFTITQPIFVGGKLLAVKDAAKNDKFSTSYELSKIKNEIIFQTVDAYLKVILLKKVVSTRANILEGIKKHKIKAEKLFDEGIIAKHNLLRAEVALAEAERNLEKDKNNLKLSIESFKNIINLESNEEIDFRDSLTFHPTEIDYDSIKALSFQNQPLLKIIEAKKELANNNFSIAISSFLPSIAAFGKYEIYPEYLSSLEPRWAVGLQLNYNLFNGFKDYLKLQNAKHLKNETEFIYKDAKNKIELLLLNSYLEIKNRANDYDKLKYSIELANENLRQNEKRFETGMGTSLEVIDAQLTLEKIELDKINTLYQYYLSLTNMFVVTGEPFEIFSVWNNQEK